MDIKPTSVDNLIRDGKTGTYYARIKIKQKVYIRSLRTETITDAKLRLPDKLDEIRNSAPGVAEITMDTRATFADAVAIYTREVNEDTRLVPATKEFRLRPAA